MVAICPNSNEVLIFERKGAEWNLIHTLAQHDSLVTGIDWAAQTNRIVTCSQDRNAYVWHLDEAGEWKPDLVILRLNRAATDVKWSPHGDKFAVASAAKVVSVCHFEEEYDWWVSKHIRKHQSTVTRVAWHPNNGLLATASTDYKARIFSAAIKGVDKKPEATVWGPVKPFGEPVCEFECNGWVHGLAFAPSGNRLVFTGHDASITFVDPAQGAAPQITTLRLSGLPVVDALYLDENKVIGVGYDCAPLLFSSSAPGTWAFVKSLDDPKPAAAGAAPAAGAGGQAEKFKMFQNMVDKGTTDSSTVATNLETKHQNAITCVNAYKRAGAKVSEFTTSGLDGNLVFWK
jgi:actin related protein 2/3 complex subunit 1A/1B